MAQLSRRAHELDPMDLPTDTVQRGAVSQVEAQQGKDGGATSARRETAQGRLEMRAAHSAVSDSFAIPQAVACQAPLSMGFSRQEYWSG